MFSTQDTIVAIATPAGRGGIGVIRLSGPDASRIGCTLTGRDTPLTPRHATFAQIQIGVRHQDRHSAGDHVVLTYFVAPASYTGEDVVEISAHGSPVVLNGILRAAIDAGARLAEPGEFTLRAFLNHKLDLVQAEAVADLIDAVTPLQARAAFDQLEGTLTKEIGAIDQALFDIMAKLEASLDFPDEGYHFVAPTEARASIDAVIARIDALLSQAARGRLIREGAAVAIVGSPNVGKSSLFNALLNANRAIVTAIPGTTRDLLTERADIGGVTLSLIDTAGVRETEDVVEREGVARAKAAIGVADVTIVLLDRSRPLSMDDRELIGVTTDRPRVVAWNKIDLPPSQPLEPLDPIEAVAISATTGAGIDRLIEAIGKALGTNEPKRDQPQVTNIRHTVLLERAKESLTRASAALESKVSEEFPLLDLQEASAALQEITGKRTSDDLLRHIFERFCIGK
ncbi:MAG TPA: tRNA uridine-5-carboxymethylaminomethyl(34) synthesis GTPase MnmE [Vicinamibacterales bacterium]|nr:tRNA uridine-5-carboxymethylaminomethyl(34) synthesis GTPase MnmE [Vicinamibacterales bacterium]